MVYWVNNSNCNHWCIELMILIVTILTQLVNYALVVHNTVNGKNSIKLKDQILHKNSFTCWNLQSFRQKELISKNYFQKDSEFKKLVF